MNKIIDTKWFKNLHMYENNCLFFVLGTNVVYFVL
jgi:hypothetical protein